MQVRGGDIRCRIRAVISGSSGNVRDWFAYAESGVRVASLREFGGSCTLLDGRLRPMSGLPGGVSLKRHVSDGAVQ